MATEELNFLQFLQSFRRGELVSEMDGRMGELMEAIQMTGGKGKMVLELPFEINKGGQIECHPKIKMDKPMKSVGAGIYYMTDDARLSRSDPNQLDMMDEFESRRERDAN